MCGKLESRQVFKLTSRVEFKFDKTTLGKQAPEWIWKKQTNEIVLTKTSLSVPRTNPFSEALFCVDNVVLFCYVQSRPLAVVEIHHGGHKRFGGRRDKSRRPLDMRSRKNIRNLTSGSPPWITNAWCLSSLMSIGVFQYYSWVKRFVVVIHSLNYKCNCLCTIVCSSCSR